MKKLITAASAAVLLLVFAASAVGTPATRTEFVGFIHFCGSGPDELFRVTPGGTVHIRGSNFNQWATTNPLIDGVENNIVLINFNPVGGNVHLDVTVEPDEYPGSTWEIRQSIHFRPDGSVSSKGVGHGTGALLGMTIKFTTGDFVTAGNPCAPSEPSALLRGVIISP